MQRQPAGADRHAWAQRYWWLLQLLLLLDDPAGGITK